jgi:hypothetical protein
MNKKKTIFDIIDLFDGNSQDIIEEKRIEDARKRIEKDSRNAKWHRLSFVEKKSVEKKGECQNCGSKEYPRWCLDNDWLLCYNCWVEQLGYETAVDVPSRGADQHRDYMSEMAWEGLWEEENEDISDEEFAEEMSSVIPLFEVFKKQLGV